MTIIQYINIFVWITFIIMLGGSYFARKMMVTRRISGRTAIILIAIAYMTIWLLILGLFESLYLIFS